MKLPERQISPSDAEIMLILAMIDMGFRHTDTSVGFVSTAYRFHRQSDDATVSVALPMIDMTPSLVGGKVREIEDALR